MSRQETNKLTKTKKTAITNMSFMYFTYTTPFNTKLTNDNENGFV